MIGVKKQCIVQNVVTLLARKLSSVNGAEKKSTLLNLRQLLRE